MEINQTTLIQFTEDFQEAVRKLEEKYGVVIEAGRITYAANEFQFKVEVKNGFSKEDIYHVDFDKYCSMYGLTYTDYMRTFINQGKEYQLIGINPKKKKNPIIIKRVSTDEEYVCSIDFIPFVRRKIRIY